MFFLALTSLSEPCRDANGCALIQILETAYGSWQLVSFGLSGVWGSSLFAHGGAAENWWRYAWVSQGTSAF